MAKAQGTRRPRSPRGGVCARVAWACLAGLLLASGARPLRAGQPPGRPAPAEAGGSAVSWPPRPPESLARPRAEGATPEATDPQRPSGLEYRYRGTELAEWLRLAAYPMDGSSEPTWVRTEGVTLVPPGKYGFRYFEGPAPLRPFPSFGRLSPEFDPVPFEGVEKVSRGFYRSVGLPRLPAHLLVPVRPGGEREVGMILWNTPEGQGYVDEAEASRGDLLAACGGGGPPAPADLCERAAEGPSDRPLPAMSVNEAQWYCRQRGPEGRLPTRYGWRWYGVSSARGKPALRRVGGGAAGPEVARAPEFRDATCLFHIFGNVAEFTRETKGEDAGKIVLMGGSYATPLADLDSVEPTRLSTEDHDVVLEGAGCRCVLLLPPRIREAYEARLVQPSIKNVCEPATEE